MDYIYKFASEGAFKRSYFEGLNNRGSEKGENDKDQCYFYDGLTYLEVEIVTQEALWDFTEEQNPVLVTPQKIADGYWVVVSFDEERPPRDNYVPWPEAQDIGRIIPQFSGREWPVA